MKSLSILIAPDKFKGSLTSIEVCDIIRRVLEEKLPGSKVIPVPLADGGEGSCELLTSLSGGSFVNVEVYDPLRRRIRTRFGLSADRTTAFIEMASASGLQLLSANERSPLKTTTFGTGEMIVEAMSLGVTSIVLGIGGSATNDGGIGLAQALGLQAYDTSGKSFQVTGENLRQIDRFEFGNIHPRLREVSFTLICDVDNPLYGPRGAANVFAPQKGASKDDIVLLDDGLRHLENVLKKYHIVDVDFPGAGAGGGLAVGLKALTNVTLVPGMKFISEFAALEKKISDSDFIITGEGHLDDQTLSGKVVKGVSDLARKYTKPVAVVVGRSSLTSEQVSILGVSKIITLVSENVSESEAVSNARLILERKVEEEILPWLLASDGNFAPQ